MHHIDGGMSELPKAFEKELKPNITFEFIVTKIEYESPPEDVHKKVTVWGFDRKTGKYRGIEGHTVIVTTPVHILREIKFVPAKNPVGTPFVKLTPSMPMQFYKAIEDIWYGPSTKIMIQCKTRFWEEYGIKGGFTKTSLPIGQLHYPSNTPKGGIKEGILLVYTWKSEALLFGSLDRDIRVSDKPTEKPDLAVLEAVRQIAEIHPEIENEFDFGITKAWYNDPAEQGAYAELKPEQQQNVRWLMYPWKNIYFAGEAISFANGWIQGALESGLRAAYQFYARNESSGGK